MTKYNELHLFIDESGNFANDKKYRLKTVGGVILFGEYTQEIKDSIKDALIKSLALIGKEYPQDLHSHDLFFVSGTQREQGIRFTQSLTQRLKNWQAATNVELYGMTINYDHDIFYSGNELLAERELDNRYLQMLWSLVEHIVFVNSKVAERLEDDAKIHLHIASRSFVFDTNSEVESVAEFYGWKIEQHRKEPNKKVVYSVIRKQELQGMFRSSLRNRWQKSHRILASINIDPIIYNKGGKTTPALYLADVLLGVELLKKNRDVSHTLLETLVNLTYDNYLESLSVCKSQLDTNGAKSLLSVIAEHPIKPVDGEIMQELVTLFKQNKEQFYQLYETALRNVNHPHYRKKGLQLQTLLDAVHEKSQLNDLRAYLHTLQIDMAYHNHTGNIKLGDFAWEQYLKLKPRFLELGEKATEFDTDFRCKRAVNLMDEFRYDEAADVLIQAGEKEEKFAQLNANFFDGNPDDFPRERRGWVYSSLGQVLAFQGDKEQAELCFRDALRCFDNKDNIEREWVYLGHLACDFPQDSQALLNEVFEHLPQNTEPFEEPFILALKLKSVYVFGDTASQNDWAKQMLAFIHNNEETLPTDHPWGLIYQITAMLFDKLGNKNQANNFYDLAIDSFCQGEGILQELCNYCKARKQGKTVPEKIRFNYW